MLSETEAKVPQSVKEDQEDWSVQSVSVIHTYRQRQIYLLTSPQGKALWEQSLVLEETFTMSCSKLPPELLDRIFQELDTRSLVKSSEVCLRWRNVTGVSNNPGYIPRVMSKIFHHLDLKTLLNARRVCSFWRDGIDIMTREAALPNKCQTILSTDFAKRLLKLEENDRHNPFPSRIVRVVMALNEKEDDTSVYKIDTLRRFGGNVRILNLRLISNFCGNPALLNLVQTMITLLHSLPNLEGLIIQLSFVSDENNLQIDPAFPNAPIDADMKKYLELAHGQMMPLMDKLKALRLVSWSPSSPETEWLCYRILQNSPNLEFLDPDISRGLKKFSEICRKPKTYPLKLKSLKLAVPGEYCHRAIGLIKPPLTKIYLDIFEYSSVRDPTCGKVVRLIVDNCSKTLKTLAVNFYKSNKTPLTLVLEFAGLSLSGSRDTSYMRHRFPIFSAIKPIFLPWTTSNVPVLENLKLRGFEGSLDFLQRFKNLKKLILLDFKTEEQKVFKEEQDFYTHLPSLTELCTPHFGSTSAVAKGHRAKMVDDEYLPMYW